MATKDITDKQVCEAPWWKIVAYMRTSKTPGRCTLEVFDDTGNYWRLVGIYDTEEVALAAKEALTL